MSGSYSIKVNRVGKKVEMVVSGTFTPEQAQKFIQEYQMKLNGIKADEFSLEFDCRDMNLVTQDMVPNLEACFKLYASTGFSKVAIGIKKEDTTILKMQLNRLGRSAGIKNLEVQQIY